ncbi:hypothetical protein IFR04_004043 [Cadophora malorum]|uniref:Uncharacterized protein n=1 Tax=Cadophora malorum TaxID=108018 RepID=A0A8H7WDJ3_9HELO|nr:hypothetical protein IFR04_004043 [Cadophora malorum]
MSALRVQLEYVVVALWYLFDLLVETWNNVVYLLTLYLVLFFLDLDDLEGITEPGLHEEEVDLPEGTEQPELPERLPEPPMLAELLLG